ncbi:MAG: SDR family NAD(P)-dependent oxidoreductase [Verrucomicrobiales bacterium]
MTRPSELPKVVLVTGASGGLGSAITTAFEQAGFVVVAGYRTSIPEAKSNVLPIRLDVGSSSDISEVKSYLEKRFGRIDALLNNAGITDDDLLLKMSLEQFQRVVQVNLKGVFNCCRAFAPLMQGQGGHIVNIGSFVGRHGAVGQSNYAASKAGLIGFSLSLARELGASNIRVNTLFPGVLKTGMTANFQQEQWESFDAANVLGRINNPAEIARFAAFLCSSDNISGQIFALDSRIGSWC